MKLNPTIPVVLVLALGLTALPADAQRPGGGEHRGGERDGQRGAGQRDGGGERRAVPREQGRSYQQPQPQQRQYPQPRPSESRQYTQPRYDAPRQNVVPRAYGGQQYADRRPSDRGYSNRNFSDRNYSDHNYSNRGYPDRGYSNRGYSGQYYSNRGYSGSYRDRGYAGYGRAVPRSYGYGSYYPRAPYRSYGFFDHYRPRYFDGPYYSFRARLNLGFGLWLGFPVPYPYGYVSSYDLPVYGYPQGMVNVGPGVAYGGLSFDISPGDAAVFVDGDYVGVVGNFPPSAAPLTISPGRHRIEVQADGYRSMVWDVEVIPGEVIPFRGEMEIY
ncbi:MAG TPA: PEGA domain-containing protein [Vicinamibacterales bacterium]|jgi:hypothetical protein